MCILRIGKSDKVPIQLSSKMFMWFYKRVWTYESESPLHIFVRALNEWFTNIVHSSIVPQGKFTIESSSTLLKDQIQACNLFISKTLADVQVKQLLVLETSAINCTKEVVILFLSIIHLYTSIDKAKNRHNIPGPFLTIVDYHRRLTELFIEAI